MPKANNKEVQKTPKSHDAPPWTGLACYRWRQAILVFLCGRPFATDQFGSRVFEPTRLGAILAIRCSRLAILIRSIGGNCSISCRRFSFSS